MRFVSTLLLLCLGFLPISTFSFQLPGRLTGASCLHKTNFLPSAEGLKTYQLPFKALAASVKIELVNAQGKVFDHCSGTVVSQSGEILTAGHCFERCLSEANGYKPTPQGSMVDADVMAAGVKCSVRINGQAVDASLLAISHCRLAERFQVAGSKVCNGLDYSLIHVNLPFKDCLPIADRQIADAKDVGTIGFPTKTYRSYAAAGSRDSDGVSQFTTGGKTILPQPFCVQNNGGQKRRVSFRADRWKHLERWLAEGTLIQAEEIDIVGGVSGSGLIDQETGEVVGISSATMVNDGFSTCSGGAFFVSTRAIVAEVTRQFPSFRASLIGCRN